MIRFFGAGENEIYVEGQFIGDIGAVLDTSVEYLVSGDPTEGMVVRVAREKSGLWGVAVIQVGLEVRIPWPTHLAMHEMGESVVLEIDCPETTEVRVL